MIEWNNIIKNEIEMLKIMKVDSRKLTEILESGKNKGYIYSMLTILENEISKKIDNAMYDKLKSQYHVEEDNLAWQNLTEFLEGENLI